jgi:glutamyl-tRNA reductase
MLNGYKIFTTTHRRTPLSAIGKFVVPHETDTQLQAKLADLKEKFQLEELMYLATCNRVLYFFYTENDLHNSFKTAFFKAIQPELDPEMVEEHVDFYEGEMASNHLYRVAASVDSLVVGEREILRQLREAYERCRSWNMTGDHLRIAMDGAVVAAKEVYGKTRLGERSVSVVSLAVKELLKSRITKKDRILLIGAGQTNALVGKFLKKYEFQNVTVFNRTLEKAERIADSLNGEAHRLSNLENFEGGFDCLIVCTGATQAVVGEEIYSQLLGSDTDKKVIIDLAVPNNVAPGVMENFNVNYIEIEGLKTLAKENLAFREKEVSSAVELLESHLDDFAIKASHRRIERALSQIPTEVKAVREKAMNEVFKKEIDTLDDDTRHLLERMMTYMEKKCTGIPMKVAKNALVPAA